MTLFKPFVVLAIALALAVFFWNTSPAQSAQECQSLEQVVIEVKQRDPQIRADVMSREATAIYLQIARQISPQTELDGHRLVVFSKMGWPNVVLAGLTESNLVCNRLLVRAPLPIHLHIMARLQRKMED